MRHVLVSYLIVFISEPDTGISISFVGEKINCLGFGFMNEKKKKKSSLFFSFFLQYGQISGVSKTFLVGSVI
jgi:hypothetical protein